MYYESNNYLQHYGVKGMKWGVRKYRNYSGSYTKAGLKRYDKSMDIYEKRKTDYKNAKSSGVKGHQLKYKKAKIKEAKRDVKKHYDHLKLDKRADEGKILYSEGRRIRKSVSGKMIALGTATAVAAGQAYARGYISANRATQVASFGVTVASGGAAMKIIENNRNRKLRAYYGHTSKY